MCAQACLYELDDTPPSYPLLLPSYSVGVGQSTGEEGGLRHFSKRKGHV